MVRVTHRLEAHVLGESDWIAATEICQLCRLDLGAVLELAELGVVAPREIPPGQWQIPATALPRLRVVGSLMRDLGVNVSGAAPPLGSLESQGGLGLRIRSLEPLASDY